MRSWFESVDRLLRGGYTRPEDLAKGEIRVEPSRLIVLAMLLGATYGVFMGLFGALRSENPVPLQLVATTLKVPLLFLLTLVVTFPSLYVVSALANSRLRFLDTLRLLLVAVAVNLALLASFGPVTAFFTLSTESYAFMIVLNVIFFTVTGFVGLGFLRRALGAVFTDPAQTQAQPTTPEAPPVRRKGGTRSRRIFATWTLIYAVVGAQMGWILRPFVGDPELPWTLFRERESNFFAALFRAFHALIVD
jgi:hypothetical protein